MISEPYPRGIPFTWGKYPGIVIFVLESPPEEIVLPVNFAGLSGSDFVRMFERWRSGPLRVRATIHNQDLHPKLGCRVRFSAGAYYARSFAKSEYTVDLKSGYAVDLDESFEIVGGYPAFHDASWSIRVWPRGKEVTVEEGEIELVLPAPEMVIQQQVLAALTGNAVIYSPGDPPFGDDRSALLVAEKVGYPLHPLDKTENPAVDFLDADIIALGGYIVNPFVAFYFPDYRLTEEGLFPPLPGVSADGRRVIAEVKRVTGIFGVDEEDTWEAAGEFVGAEMSPALGALALGATAGLIVVAKAIKK